MNPLDDDVLTPKDLWVVGLIVSSSILLMATGACTIAYFTVKLITYFI